MFYFENLNFIGILQHADCLKLPLTYWVYYWCMSYTDCSIYVFLSALPEQVFHHLILILKKDKLVHLTCSTLMFTKVKWFAVLALFYIVKSNLFLSSLVLFMSASRLAGYVEALASRLGMQIPDLSPKQADMWQTRVSSHSVCTIVPRSASTAQEGIFMNLLIGLIWFETSCKHGFRVTETQVSVTLPFPSFNQLAKKITLEWFSLCCDSWIEKCNWLLLGWFVQH